MKLKISKTTILAMFFIFLMVGSTLAYSILQVFSPSEPGIELPEGNIIDYELTSEQEIRLLTNGKTILRFEYYLTCVECLDQKTLLEGLTNQFSNQILLQEILTDDSTSLTITSRYGQEDLKNITQDTVIDSLCSLMADPPVGCIRRGV